MHKKPLTPGILKEKMDVRVTHGKYFDSPRDGHYACRAV